MQPHCVAVPVVPPEGGFESEKLLSNFQLVVLVAVGGSTGTRSSAGSSRSVVLLTATHCGGSTAGQINGGTLHLPFRDF